MAANPSKLDNMPVHVVYGVTLLFLLATRYYLYLGPGKEALQLNFGHALGANLGYFLTWGLGYYLCLTTPSKTPITALGFLSVVAGPLLAPIVGYGLVGVMYFIRRRQKKTHTSAARKTPKSSETLRSRILDPRTPTGLLSLVFWVLLAAYITTQATFILYLLAILIAANLLARIFPIRAHLTYSRLLRLVTWGATREVNAMVAALPGLSRKSTAELNELVLKPNPLLQEAVLDELKTRGDESSVKTLLALADRSEGHTLASVIDTIGAIADAQHGPEVARFLDHEDPRVRCKAAAGLVKMNAKDDVDRITVALSKESDARSVRKLFRAVFDLGGVDAVLARWKDLPAAIKAGCIDVIKEDVHQPGPEAASFLASVANDDDPQTRAAVGNVQRLMLCYQTRDAYPALFDYTRDNIWHGQDPILFQNAAFAKRFAPEASLGKAAEGSVGRNRFALSGGFRDFATSSDQSDILTFVIKPESGTPNDWQMESIVDSDEFLKFYAGRDKPMPATYFLKCPERYRKAFFDALVLSNVQSSDDGREVYDFAVGGMPLSVITKYAQHYLDIALSRPDEQGNMAMHVCFKQLFDRASGNEIPPFVVQFDLLTFLAEERETFITSETEEDIIEITSPIITGQALH